MKVLQSSTSAGAKAKPSWRLLITMLLASAMVLALGCAPSEERQSELAAIHEKQARAYQSSGQYRASIIEARNVIQKAPAEARGYVLLAGILVELGQYKTALDVLEQAPPQATGNEFTRLKVEALLGRGKFASALELMDSQPELFRRDGEQGTYLRARSLIGLKRLDEASTTLQASLKTEPKNIATLVALADIAVLQDDAEAARSLLNRANEIDPTNIDANLLRAKIAILAGDYAAAETQLSDTLIQIPQADTITPKKATILSALADVLVKQGRSAEALIYTRILAEAFPGFEVAQEKYREAVALFESGDMEDAQAKLEALLKEYPNFENANVLLAVIRFQQGDFEQAAAQLNETVDPELVHPDITRITALSNLRSNRPQQAMDVLENFAGTANDARLLTIYGTSALSLQQTQKGVQALEKAIALEPGLTPAYIALAAHYKDEGTAGQKKALQLLQTAYSNDKDDAALANALVAQLVAAGQTGVAEKIVAQQLEAQPNGAASHSLAAAFYATQKRFGEAEKHYRTVLKAEPDNYKAALQLAVISTLAKQDYEETLQLYANAAAIDANRTAAYEYMLRTARDEAQFKQVKAKFDQIEQRSESKTASAILAAYLASRGQYDEASNILATLNETNTDPGVLERARYAVYSIGARAQFANKDYESAKQNAFAALRISPQSTALLGLLASIEIANENYPEAEKIISQVASIDEASSNILRGDLLSAQGAPADALASYLQAWKQKPSEAAASKIYTLLETADPKRANEFLASWSASNPNSLAALALTARNLLVRQNYSKAIPLMEKIQARSPGNVTNLNNLAWAYQQTGNPKASDVAARAYELAPDTAAVADTYGWILYQKGERQKAIEILEKAAALDADNEEIAGHLAQARKGA